MPVFVHQKGQDVATRPEDMTETDAVVYRKLASYMTALRRCDWCTCYYVIACAGDTDCTARNADHYNFQTEEADIHVPWNMYKCMQNETWFSPKASIWQNPIVVSDEKQGVPVEVILRRKPPGCSYSGLI